MTQANFHETARTRTRYQRISRIYDLMEILPERRYAPWRKRLWALVEGKRVLDPVVVRLMGPHINRRTVENVQKAGFILERVEDLGMGDIFKFIQARKEMTTNAT